MSDDFDIDKFLNDNFSKIENKVNKTKKVDKVLTKFNKLDETKTNIDFKLGEYNFEKVISSSVLSELSLPNFNSSNIKLENVIKPLFSSDKIYENEFKNSDRNFILDRFIGNPSKKKQEDCPPTNLPTQLKINKFKKIKESSIIKTLKNDSSITYSSFISMNKLWKEYISNLLNKTTQADTINSKMLKADLHGAIIEVVQSKNKNLNNIRGLNLLETKRTFNLLCEDDQIKTVLKKGCIFSVDLPYEEKKISIKIIGDNFMYKAVERTKAKFKNKYNL